MKKKNKIIIGIAVVVVAVIAVIVGITVNNHQKAEKEAESISVSVEASKTDLITSYTKQFTDITSKEYKTEDEYNSAKNLLISLKDEINKNDEMKDNNEIVSLIKNIDDTIKDYDERIKSLTTTETTTEEVTENEITTKNTSSNKTTTKNNSSKPNNSSNSEKPKQTTTKQSTTKETTTKKKYKPTPAYGTVVTSKPNPDDYEDYSFYCCTIYYTWEDGEWYVSRCTMGGSMSAGEAYDLALPYVSEPNRNGKYEGEIVEKDVWIWC